VRDLDRYQSDYVASYGFERHMVRYRRRQVLSCIMEFPHRRILEVGCGLDSLVQYMDGWETFDIVEPAGTFAERARALTGTAGAFTVHEATLEQAAPTLSGRPFDFIVVSSLIHEVAAPLDLLRAARSLCQGDTVVHVNVPNARSLHNRIAVAMGLIPDVFARSALADRMQRTNTYDGDRLAAVAREAGFTVESSGSYFLKPFTHSQLQQMLDQKIIDERVLDALYEVNTEFDDLGAEIYVNLRKA
jgi:2-polyprenyl-3-methyl-5-hydroxy-6-metoxy-1,4-benzoquinol methylase